MAGVADVLAERFGPAAEGVAWAFGQIPGAALRDGELRVDGRRLLLRKGAAGLGDSYRVAWSRRGVALTSSTAVGAIGGLLEIARQVAAGSVGNVRRDIPFRTRFYKHEVQMEGPARRA